jgi:lysophospholipase L1-like esterase
MSEPRARVPRHQVAAGAAYAGGAATALGALGVGLLFGQALIARMSIPGAEAPPPRCDGDYGTEFAGSPGMPPSLRLAVIGDSTAAGYGVTAAEQTPGALLAGWISQAAKRPVHLTCPAVVGSISAWLAHQVQTVLEAGVDLAIIFIGANDVTTRTPVATATGFLGDAVRALRGAGAGVVVATCPDLGTIRPIQPPLRWLARRWSRQLAAAQAVVAIQAGARAVSLGDLLGPQFAAAPDQMFGADRYHPSADGYRAAAEAVLHAALASLGLAGELPAPTAALARAAVHAARTPGTEITPHTASVAPPEAAGLPSDAVPSGVAAPKTAGHRADRSVPWTHPASSAGSPRAPASP